MFKGLIQVGFISRELDRIMDSYVSIYGIGPWYLLKFCPANVTSMTVYGKEQEYEMNVAVCPVGDVRFEYIEPITKSIFSDFYKHHNEDIIHHLKFDVDDYKEAMDFLRLKDIDLIQSGHQLGDRGKNIFNFFNTEKEFGFTTEIVNVTKDFIKPQPESWVGSDHGDFSPIFKNPSVIGIAVKNLGEKISKYMEFGIGPWDIRDFGKDDNLNFEARMAFCKFGNIMLKLIEPKSESIFSEDLLKYGEAIHHIKMEVDNYKEQLGYLQSKGVKTLYTGNYSDEINFSFMDTKKHLNFIIEISDKKITGRKLESGIIVHP